MLNFDTADKKILFTRMRNEVKIKKSSAYLNWLRAKNPGKDAHHLLGSSFGLKFTDYLLVMLTREEHREVEPTVGATGYNKADGFIKYLPAAINNLIEYIEFLQGGLK